MCQVGGGSEEADDENGGWTERGEMIHTTINIKMPRFVVEAFSKLPLEGRWDLQRILDEGFMKSTNNVCRQCTPKTPRATLRDLIAHKTQADFDSITLPVVSEFLAEYGL
eukprot:tig00021728_g23293.t1